MKKEDTSILAQSSCHNEIACFLCRFAQMCLSCHSNKNIVRSIFAHLESFVQKHTGIHPLELIQAAAAVRIITDLPGEDLNSWSELVIPGWKNT